MLSLVAAVTITLSVCGHNASSELLAKAEEVRDAAPNNRVSAADELCSLWQKHVRILSLSLHKSEVEESAALIYSIKESAIAENSDLFFSTLCRLLTEQLSKIKKLHSVTLEGVL